MTSSSASARRARALLGTYVEISASGLDLTRLHDAIDRAFAAVETVHRLMSFQESDSELSQLNRQGPAAALALHPWTRLVLDTAAELRQRSRGAFDVAVGLGGSIDLSGIAKGFAVDRAVDVLCAAGVREGAVNAGGDLSVFGKNTHRVGVRDPGDPARLAAVVTLRNEALASSGRAIDPRSRRLVATVVGATVRAPSCMIADALTKVVGVMAEAATPLLHHYEASATLFRSGSVVRLAA